jgi:hypothetical protein
MTAMAVVRKFPGMGKIDPLIYFKFRISDFEAQTASLSSQTSNIIWTKINCTGNQS